MGFNLDRRMYDLLRCMPTIPGAIGALGGGGGGSDGRDRDSAARWTSTASPRS